MKKITAKIVDFDGGFFEDDPPQFEDELGGDQVYLAPEACLFMCGEPVELTCKIDVFSLGLIFHQILTGNLPEYNTDEYDYAFEAVLDNQQLGISSSIDKDLKTLLERMLLSDPSERINMVEVFLTLKKMDGDSEDDESTNSEEPPKPPEDPWFHMAGDL